MGRPAEGLVPEFERRSVAAAAGLSWEAFDALPTPEQAAYVAWHRARSWSDALEHWSRLTKSS
jgi:hypothetical protein